MTRAMTYRLVYIISMFQLTNKIHPGHASSMGRALVRDHRTPVVAIESGWKNRKLNARSSPVQIASLWLKQFKATYRQAAGERKANKST